MTNELSETQISELMCTRISHDLIGNIGAVSNAVELLEEGDMDFLGDIKSILKTSSAALAGRLKFFRLAFGVDNANLDNLPLLEETMRGYLATIGNRNYPIELECGLTNPKYSRGVLALVMIIADGLIRGGKIKISEADGKVQVLAEADLLPPAEKMAKLKAVLTGADTELNAQFAPVFYLLSWLKKATINLYILNSSQPGFVLA